MGATGAALQDPLSMGVGGAGGAGRGEYACLSCGKVYLHRSSLSHHTRFECGKEPQFACPHCPHRCKRKGNFRRHLLTHNVS